MSLDLDALFSDPANRTYGKTATYRKYLDGDRSFVECKAQTPTSKNGILEGYASVWDVVDHQGEIVRRGAFAKTIAERGAKIPIMIVHFARGGDVMEAVGASVALKEDEYGLKFEAEYLDDEKSQAVRDKILALRKQGVKVGTSIGYRVINYGYVKDDRDGRTYVELKELALGEITVTLKPANEVALVTGAKSDEERSAILKPFDVIEDAKIEELDDAAKTALVDSVYGSAEQAKTFAEALKGIADKTLALIASESQSVGSKDGDTKPEDTASQAQEPNSGNGSSTEGKIAERRARKREIERRRLDFRKHNGFDTEVTE